MTVYNPSIIKLRYAQSSLILARLLIRSHMLFYKQLITTFQGVEEQKVLVNPSTDGVQISLQVYMYVVHWGANNLI